MSGKARLLIARSATYFDNTIKINEPGTYGFRAWNGNSGSPVLQKIQNLEIDGGVTGQVTVKIAYSSGGGAGATNIEAMTLTGSTPVKLAMLNISGDLGTEDDVDIDVLDGPLTAHNLWNTVMIHDMTAGADDIHITHNLQGALWIDDPNVVRDIHVGNDLDGYLLIDQDLKASIEVDGVMYGTIDILGDVLDQGANHIWIEQMADDSEFICDDMALQNSGDVSDLEWFVLGKNSPLGTTQDGEIVINGTLSGTLFLRTKTSVDIDINVLDSPQDSTDTNHPMGGIRSFGGFAPGSYIRIADFERGAIHRAGAHCGTPGCFDALNGTIEIVNDLGKDVSGNVAAGGIASRGRIAGSNVDK